MLNYTCNIDAKSLSVTWYTVYKRTDWSQPCLFVFSLKCKTVGLSEEGDRTSVREGTKAGEGRQDTILIEQDKYRTGQSTTLFSPLPTLHFGHEWVQCSLDEAEMHAGTLRDSGHFKGFRGSQLQVCYAPQEKGDSAIVEVKCESAIFSGYWDNVNYMILKWMKDYTVNLILRLAKILPPYVAKL